MRKWYPIVLGAIVSFAGCNGDSNGGGAGCTCPSQAPVGVPVNLVNMIPVSLSGESNQDSEPFLAIDRTDPERMVGSAFTPNPFGTSSGLAPVYVSLDGGETWTLNMIVPSAGQLGTGDITVATSDVASRLYGGILRRPGDLLLNNLRTDDFASPLQMEVLAARTRVDQPFAQATTATATGQDRVYVGNNDFEAPSGRTATIDLSVDGNTFESVRIETRSTGGQDGPSIRPTVARDGTVYAAYFGWRSFTGGTARSDVVVVRDDGGGASAPRFQDLTDPDDGLPGRRVVEDVSIPWSNAPTLGFERIGSSLSAAVHPDDSDVIYVAWADRVGNGDIYTIHVRRSSDRGETWSEDLRTITNATCFSLAVAGDGTLGFLYQQLVEPGDCTCWVTHLEQTRDAFETSDDTILASVSGDEPEPLFLPYMGDYNFLLADGGEFRGIFSANNTPTIENFPNGVQYQRNADFDRGTLSDNSGRNVAVSIDPFYFSVGVIP